MIKDQASILTAYSCTKRAMHIPFQNQHLHERSPMWSLVIGWVTLLPLLFFATNGNLVPETSNVAFRVTAAEGGGLSHQLPVGIIALVCSALIGKRMRSVFSRCREMKAILALPFLALLSALWSEDPRQSMVSGLLLLVFTLFAFYLSDRFNYESQIELTIFTGAIALPASILLALLVPDVGTTPTGWRGIFGHKNNCAAVTTLLLVTALHWRVSPTRMKIFRAGYVLMCVLVIAMSQSRTGWGLTLLALVLSASLWLAQKLKAKDGLAVALTVSPALGGLAFLIYHYGSAILYAIGKDPTLTQRTFIWAAVWNAAAKHMWLGYGYAAFWDGLNGASQSVVLAAGWVLAQAQDGYLDLWLQLGAGSLLLLALTILQAAKNVSRCFRLTADASYVRWCIVVLVCTLVYNIGESSVGMPRITWLIFLLACIGLHDKGTRGERARAQDT